MNLFKVYNALFGNFNLVYLTMIGNLMFIIKHARGYIWLNAAEA